MTHPWPTDWVLSNDRVEERLASLMRAHRDVPFDRAEICVRCKNGRTRWECGVMIKYTSGDDGWHALFHFFYPTKDMAIAKAVELMLKGVVKNYTEGKVR